MFGAGRSAVTSGNEFKGEHWSAEGPQRILHPLNDHIDDHLELEASSQLRP